MDAIKRIAFSDFTKKRRYYKYRVKKALNLQEGDTVQGVMGSVPNLEQYDAEDFECPVYRWLMREDLVCHLLVIYQIDGIVLRLTY